MSTASLRGQVAPIFVALAVIAVVWLLPDVRPDPADVGLSPVTAERGVVVAIEPVEPDPDDPFAEAQGPLIVRLVDGARGGEELRAFVGLPSTQATAEDFRVGDEVVVTFTEQADGPAFVAVSERWRLPVMALLVIAFAGAIVAVGGWRGLRALVALALTVALVVKILVPAILEGMPPVPLAVGLAGIITVATILLTEGLGRTSLAAILGTVGGLGVTAVVSALVGDAAAFSGAPAGEIAFLELPSGDALDVRGLLLAAIILGAVGVLDDVTVSQAATVEELAAATRLRSVALWQRALRVGRSHIAATVNTLFMAYVGASLPLIVFLALSAEPTLLTLDREALALEVVRTLAGGLGIVAAMPLTTAIATLFVNAHPPTLQTHPAEPDEREMQELVMDRPRGMRRRGSLRRR
ncbi:hypothetical protein BH23CHL8_BH23CHL8_16140 [soil metagenome]